MSTKLILRNYLSPGDIVMLTAAVRDLHHCYPGQFVTDVRTPYPQLWENNPYLTPLDEKDPEVKCIDCHYPLIQRSNQEPYHFIHAFIAFLNEQLQLDIKPTAFKGDIHVSDVERSWHSQIREIVGDDRPFWIVTAGGKLDFTNKWWDAGRYQEVIDYFQNKILFVQIGRMEDHHPGLEGVIDLRGNTDLRQLIRLVYHSQGVLCPVTAVMHLAAAVPTKSGQPLSRPCVVIAGGREPSQWEAYPHHQFLHTIGALPCCETGGCWKSRTVPIGDGDEKDRAENLCVNVVGHLPKCMDMITSAEVVRRIELYFTGGVARYLTTDDLPMPEHPRQTNWEELSKPRFLTAENALAISEEVIKTIPAYPKHHRDRGIVICAGGVKYFTNAWVCINMLRKLGCQLPIQIWHFGSNEIDETMKGLVARFDVECVDAEVLREKFPCRILEGWPLKPYAIIHCPFREVLLLDADNVPLVNPEALFELKEYRDTGAVFWPDYGKLAPRRAIWAICGVSFRHEPEFETGQILVDKSKCWRALLLAMWYNANGDFYYRFILGDKDTFHMAFRKLNQPYAMTSRRILPLYGTMCQHDFKGARIFQHRNLAKWQLHGENRRVEGFLYEDECLGFLDDLRKEWQGAIAHNRRCEPNSGIAALLTSNVYDYRRKGHDGREMTFNCDGSIGQGSGECEQRWDLRKDPEGNICLEIFGESGLTCELVLGPDGVWRGPCLRFELMEIELVMTCQAKLRDGTTDALIWKAVYEENTYGLPNYFHPHDVILDVGAHTGAFSCACIARGAKSLYAYEPDRENFDLASINIRRWYQMHHPREHHVPICLENCAIWRSDRTEEIAISQYPPANHQSGLIDTGGAGTVFRAPESQPCKSIGLDVLLDELPRVTLMKLHCEGAEWPIIFTSKALAKIERILVQVHPISDRKTVAERDLLPSIATDVPQFTPAVLVRHLELAGFEPAESPFLARPKVTTQGQHGQLHECAPLYFRKHGLMRDSIIWRL